MKAVVLRRYGSVDHLQPEEVETPGPEDDEVLIRVHATSINDWDASLVTGSPIYVRMLHGWLKPNVGIPGCDVAGVVEAVGGAVTRFRPGDAVYGDLHRCGFGTWAEYVCGKETDLEPIPSGLSFEQAAAIPHSATLAWQALYDLGDLGSAETLLVNGAGGGVGPIALQLARLHSVEVTGVDHAGKLEGLRAAGFDHVIDYRSEDFTRSGRTWDLILDVKTTRSPAAYARALNPGGRYATVGGTPAGILRFMLSSKRVARREGKPMAMLGLEPNRGLAEMAELFESSRVLPIVDGPWPMGEVAKAMRRFADGKQLGRIVLNLGSQALQGP